MEAAVTKKGAGRELAKWVALILLWLYVGAYYVMVEPAENRARRRIVPVYPVGYNAELWEPRYGSLHRWFFAPIHWVDRRLRPHFWEWPRNP
jgi:hypothetical protein